MTGHEYLKSYLTEAEQNAFVDNIMDNNPEEFIGVVLDMQHKSLHMFMSMSFFWNGTPQSHKYWENISNRETKQL